MSVSETCSLALLVKMRALESFVDAEVDGAEEDEGDDSCGKQSCPVGVVHDVGGIQPGMRTG